VSIGQVLELRHMRVLEAKEFLVQQTAEQAALENVPLSDLEKRMMYFTETGECPEDPIALNNAFEAEYDTTTYEKKISLLMAQAYRRIKRENPEGLRLWNNAFHVLSKGDHYLLLFWRQNTFRNSPRMWRTYLLVALAGASLWLLMLFFFGNKGGMRRGQQAPIDKYLPSLSPMVQHTLQVLFLLAFLFAVFPQLSSKLVGLFRGLLESTALARRQK
jgi:hypothetical protein